MKRVGLVAAVLVLVLSVAVGGFFLRYRKMTRVVTAEYKKIQPIDLSTVPNGNHAGEFGDFLVLVKLEVSVEDHRITNIRMVDQRCGKGYEALETLGRIVEAQSPRVDAVSGATGSSKCIMVAAYRALTAGSRVR